MNPIEEQKQIIDQLYHEIISCLPDTYTSAECLFEYDHGYDYGSYSVGSQLTYFIDDKKFTDRAVKFNNMSRLVVELHKKMQQHTGGNWACFKISVADDGSVKTNFVY